MPKMRVEAQMNELISNPEAEQAVLAAIILENDSLDKIPWLEETDFHEKVNQILFGQFRFMQEQDIPIDLVYIYDNIRKYADLEINILEYYEKLAASAATAKNIEYYARIVSNASTRRKGVSIAEDLKELSTGFVGSVTAYAAAYEKKLDELRPKNINSGLKHIKETRQTFFAHMERPDDFIKTDSKAFDDWGGGYARKSLIIKAGRPSVGRQICPVW